MLTLLLKGVVWTKKDFMFTSPDKILIEVNEELFEMAKEEGYLSDFLKNEVAESFVFVPHRIATYQIRK